MTRQWLIAMLQKITDAEMNFARESGDMVRLVLSRWVSIGGALGAAAESKGRRGDDHGACWRKLMAAKPWFLRPTYQGG